MEQFVICMQWREEINFNVVVPKARKEREIVQRDYLDRIVASKVPELRIP